MGRTGRRRSGYVLATQSFGTRTLKLLASFCEKENQTFALAQEKRTPIYTAIDAGVVPSAVQGQFRIGFQLLRRSGNRAHGERHTDVHLRIARGGQEGAEGSGSSAAPDGRS
jgi:hypothetical protein